MLMEWHCQKEEGRKFQEALCEEKRRKGSDEMSPSCKQRKHDLLELKLTSLEDEDVFHYLDIKSEIHRRRQQ